MLNSIIIALYELAIVFAIIHASGNYLKFWVYLTLILFLFAPFVELGVVK